MTREDIKDIVTMDKGNAPLRELSLKGYYILHHHHHHHHHKSTYIAPDTIRTQAHYKSP